MSIGGVFMLGGSQINSHPEYCIGDLKRLLRLLDLYQWCSGVHPIGVPKHIRLYGGGKTSYIPQYPQGRVLRGTLVSEKLCQVWTGERHPTKKWQ